MRSSELTRSLSQRLLQVFIKVSPTRLKPWAEALSAETDSIPGTLAPLAFALSGMFGLAHMGLRNWRSATAVDFPSRPWAVALICFYHVALSGLLLGVLIEQLLTHAIHEPWKDAFFPVVFAFLVALVPAVIALGLWVMDNAARWMCMLFTIFHFFSTSALLNSLVHSPWRTGIAWLRLLLDAAILASLNLPSIRRSFRNQSAELRLHDA